MALEGQLSAQSLRAAKALAFVADLESPELEPEDAHHFAKALRLRDGEVVAVCDGAGRYRFCRIAGRSLRPDTPIEVQPDPAWPVTIGFSIAKGDRNDWAVAKLTELGVDRIVPLACARSSRPDAWRPERLRRIVRESAMQARIVRLPELAAPTAPAGLAAPAGVALAEPGGLPPTLATATILVGPEGGWAPEELALGLPTVGLGPGILRIETAAVTAAGLLAGLRSGIVAPSQQATAGGGMFTESSKVGKLTS